MQAFVDFVRDIYQRSDFIGLHEPVFRGNEKKYLNECIDSGYVSSVGKFVDLFEKSIADYTGSKYAVAAVNGTAALHMALILSGVTAEDEVLTQPLTFVATANAISYIGASAVFIDIDRDTLSLSANKLEDFLKTRTFFDKHGYTINSSTKKRIRCCIPMHTFGHPAKIDRIADLCKQYNITLVEDSCESIGSYYKGQHTGTFGSLGTLSFNGNKTITTGSGGMILTNDEQLARKAKHLTTQAKVAHPYEYVHDHIGYNYRLSNVSAAIGVAQVEQLDEFISKKRDLAKKYQQFFRESGIQFVTEPSDSVSNYWLNAILLENKKERNDFLDFTNKNGVMTRPAWELMNKLTMFKQFQTENIETAEWIADRLVNIPSTVK